MKKNSIMLSGLVGGIIFAVVYNIFSLLRNDGFSWIGVLGGIVFWLTQVLIAAYTRGKEGGRK